MSLLKEHNLIFLLPADRYATEQMLGETFRSRGSGPEGLNLSPRILHPPTPPLWYSRHRTTGPAPFQNGMASSVDDPKFPASGGSCTPPRRSPPDRRQMLFSEAATCSWTPYFHDAYALGRVPRRSKSRFVLPMDLPLWHLAGLCRRTCTCARKNPKCLGS